MAKKMLSGRLEEEGDFWEEIDRATKQKILDQVRKEMTKNLVIRNMSPKRKNLVIRNVSLKRKNLRKGKVSYIRSPKRH